MDTETIPKSIEDLFNEVVLYDNSQLTFDLTKEEDRVRFSNLFDIQEFYSRDEKFDSYCIKCKKNRVFSLSESFRKNQSIISISDNMFRLYLSDIDEDTFYKTDIELSELKDKRQVDLIDKMNDYEYYENTYNSFTLPLYTNCSYDRRHTFVILLKFLQYKEKVYVMKVGQDPAPYTLDKHKYRYLDKTLKKIDKSGHLKEDLNSAIELNGLGYSIPVTLYCRRILEKLVKYYLNQNHPQYTETKFEDKYNKVKENFSEELREIIKDFYTITSDSIHTYTEPESEEIKSVLLEAIIFELKALHNKIEESKESRKIASAIKKHRSKKE